MILFLKKGKEQMYSKVYSAAIQGIAMEIVAVETDVSDGLPSFEMVGLLNSEVKEARERVRSAIKNTGYLLPPKRITVNLSPADIRKEGSSFDLPIAVSILTSLGLVCKNNGDDEKILVAGELSLSGNILPMNGVLPMILAAREKGIRKAIVILPSGNISSKRHPKCRYSFSSIEITKIEPWGFNNFLAIFNRFCIIESHLL